MERDKQIDSIVAKVDAEALQTQQDYEGKLRYGKPIYGVIWNLWLFEYNLVLLRVRRVRIEFEVAYHLVTWRGGVRVYALWPYDLFPHSHLKTRPKNKKKLNTFQ